MSYRTKSMIIGVVAGALLGAAFAWVASDGKREGEEGELGLASLGPTDYFQLGISILTLARQFGGMLKRA
jgi:hypothetical protein